MQDDQIFCPACEDATEHIAVKSGRENLVKCDQCGTVHPISVERPRLSTVNVIVNVGEQSLHYHINVPARDELRVGNELLVDEPSKEVVMTQITSIETDRRVDHARGEEIKTIWARAIDFVTVKFSVYYGHNTRSLKMETPGDEAFSVGETRTVEGVRFIITKIKLRGEGFTNEAQAKDIVRVWGRES
jgi:uncharacterized Zn finger protein